MMLQKVLLTVSLMVLFIVCVELLSSMPPEPNQDAIYCEMTALYNDTDGDLGWPAYNDKINCDAFASVN